MKTKDLANTLIDDVDFAVVDVETTGMHCRHNRIVDIGIVQVKNGQIVDKWEALIDPLQQIPYFITFYTHISDTHVRGKPTFTQLSSDIFNRLSSKIFVGHNVGFDYSFVTEEFKRQGLVFDCPRLCTVMLGRKLLPQLANAHLDALSEYYNIKISARHRALPDAYATALILLEFIKLAKERHNAKTFTDLHALQYLKVSKTLDLAAPLFS